MAPNRVPMYSVGLIVIVSVALGMLQFASSIALNAVFSLCAIALDSSYAVPILCAGCGHGASLTLQVQGHLPLAPRGPVPPWPVQSRHWRAR